MIVVGDPGVGKTSFIHRFTSNVFCHDYRGTVGVDFSTALVDLPGGQARVRLQLWDIAGQERFTWMTRVYYREVIRLSSVRNSLCNHASLEIHLHQLIFFSLNLCHSDKMFTQNR